jgi:hypothetical protein
MDIGTKVDIFKIALISLYRLQNMDAIANNRFGSSTDFDIISISEDKDAKNTKNATKVALLCLQQFKLDNLYLLPSFFLTST